MAVSWLPSFFNMLSSTSDRITADRVHQMQCFMFSSRSLPRLDERFTAPNNRINDSVHYPRPKPNRTTFLFRGVIQVSSDSDTGFSVSFDSITQLSYLTIHAGAIGKYYISGGILLGRVDNTINTTDTPDNQPNVMVVADDPAMLQPIFIKHLTINQTTGQLNTRRRRAVLHFPPSRENLPKRVTKRRREPDDEDGPSEKSGSNKRRKADD